MKSNNNDLEKIRKQVKDKMIEWAKDGIELREIAVDYVDLLNDLVYLVSLNEEISYKFHAVMSCLPNEQDIETLMVIHKKTMKHAQEEQTAHDEKAEIEKLAVLLEAKQKFNKD